MTRVCLDLLSLVNSLHTLVNILTLRVWQYCKGSTFSYQTPTWTCSGSLAKHHEGKLVRFVVRVEVLRIKIVWVYEILPAVDKMVEVDMDNPALGNDNIRVRNLVISGASPLMGSEQHLVSEQYLML